MCILWSIGWILQDFQCCESEDDQSKKYAPKESRTWTQRTHSRVESLCMNMIFSPFGWYQERSQKPGRLVPSPESVVHHYPRRVQFQVAITLLSKIFPLNFLLFFVYKLKRGAQSKWTDHMVTQLLQKSQLEQTPPITYILHDGHKHQATITARTNYSPLPLDGPSQLILEEVTTTGSVV